ncbi:hypothetical protein AUK40_04535 [Candidatus Wirthbacteria bacterium CG2_30_54_11]|uniref:Antitoxin n=1 Tax=Candidatus Wirthbacteria bacterium CG2_30_54_11 TaxID=1817892 RepID=A0A1J5IU97_9BACT|nr:MAG: hypothetical protein AUK40_04535 [Candidatus Wirthbacteria bacterium CG2_30_54_11]
MEFISSALIRSQFSDILAQTYYQNKKFMIRKSNRPMAILLSIEEYEQLAGVPSKKPKGRKNKP